jgi:hypothetical protein
MEYPILKDPLEVKRDISALLDELDLYKTPLQLRKISIILLKLQYKLKYFHETSWDSRWDAD